jgi:four helix bundle protein
MPELDPELDPILTEHRPTKRLSHENLRVYQIAIQFLGLAADIVDRLPKGHATLADQLRRASLSVPLNIAEAAGRKSRADCARCFAIARGSALECGAVLDACVVLRLCEKETAVQGKELLVSVVSMLSKLSR